MSSCVARMAGICLCLTAGCGHGGDAQTTGAGSKASPAVGKAALSEVDACKIVSREEVEAAVGWKVDSTGPGSAQFAGSACNFYGKTISDLVGVAIANQGFVGMNSSAQLAAFFSDTAKHGMFAVDAGRRSGRSRRRVRNGLVRGDRARQGPAPGGRHLAQRGGVEEPDQESPGPPTVRSWGGVGPS